MKENILKISLKYAREIAMNHENFHKRANSEAMMNEFKYPQQMNEVWANDAIAI